jgi:subtilase family serine protease
MHRQFLLALAFCLLLIPLLLTPLSAFAEPMVAIPNNHPAIEVPAFSAPPDRELRLTVMLKLRNHIEFLALPEERNNPLSPEYKHEWTPSEVHERFGPLESDFVMVEQWLKDQGFSIVSENYGKDVSDSITFTGSVAKVEKAFSTSIRTSPSGNLFTNNSDPVVPARIAALIDHIYGLDNTTPPAIPQCLHEQTPSALDSALEALPDDGRQSRRS